MQNELEEQPLPASTDELQDQTIIDTEINETTESPDSIVAISSSVISSLDRSPIKGYQFTSLSKKTKHTSPPNSSFYKLFSILNPIGLTTFNPFFTSFTNSKESTDSSFSVPWIPTSQSPSSLPENSASQIQTVDKTIDKEKSYSNPIENINDTLSEPSDTNNQTSKEVSLHKNDNPSILSDKEQGKQPIDSNFDLKPDTPDYQSVPEQSETSVPFLNTLESDSISYLQDIDSSFSSEKNYGDTSPQEDSISNMHHLGSHENIESPLKSENIVESSVSDTKDQTESLSEPELDSDIQETNNDIPENNEVFEVPLLDQSLETLENQNLKDLSIISSNQHSKTDSQIETLHAFPETPTNPNSFICIEPNINSEPDLEQNLDVPVDDHSSPATSEDVILNATINNAQESLPPVESKKRKDSVGSNLNIDSISGSTTPTRLASPNLFNFSTGSKSQNKLPGFFPALTPSKQKSSISSIHSNFEQLNLPPPVTPEIKKPAKLLSTSPAISSPSKESKLDNPFYQYIKKIEKMSPCGFEPNISQKPFLPPVTHGPSSKKSKYDDSTLSKIPISLGRKAKPQFNMYPSVLYRNNSKIPLPYNELYSKNVSIESSSVDDNPFFNKRESISQTYGPSSVSKVIKTKKTKLDSQTQSTTRRERLLSSRPHFGIGYGKNKKENATIIHHDNSPTKIPRKQIHNSLNENLTIRSKITSPQSVSANIILSVIKNSSNE
ncbi:hypothetical protein BB560_002629 [Smittium megazygosporum]|uniref:Uncharacterized protein n=1 Tax=Smittium megazygosporum TaxID=133381 RepID=A0A2T9ZEC9_9FUNG|nr:hypothetical protein BB560_002629 [Smittium megazygosporum]